MYRKSAELTDVREFSFVKQSEDKIIKSPSLASGQWCNNSKEATYKDVSIGQEPRTRRSVANSCTFTVISYLHKMKFQHQHASCHPPKSSSKRKYVYMLRTHAYTRRKDFENMDASSGFASFTETNVFWLTVEPKRVLVEFTAYN